MTSFGQRIQQKGHQPILSLASGGLAGLQSLPSCRVGSQAQPAGGQEAKEADAVPGLSGPTRRRGGRTGTAGHTPDRWRVDAQTRSLHPYPPLRPRAQLASGSLTNPPVSKCGAQKNARLRLSLWLRDGTGEDWGPGTLPVSLPARTLRAAETERADPDAALAR